MATRMRWSDTGASLIGARDDAYLPSITDEPARVRQLGRWRVTDAFRPDGRIYQTSPVGEFALVGDQEIEEDAPRGTVRHTHVYLDGWAPIQAAPRRTHDAVSLPSIQRPAGRRDQAGDPEPGTLVCRLMQNGETGQWGGADGDGRPLTVTRGDDGALEIRHAGNGEEEDPDKLASQGPPSGADAGAGRAFERRMSAALSPSRDADQTNPRSIRGFSALLASHYRRP
jgi:hypothetical protein